jgi:hypothetical protein
MQSLTESLRVMESHPKSCGVPHSHTESRRNMQSHAEWSSITWSHAKSCRVTQSHAESRKVMWNHVKSCSVTQSHAESCGITEITQLHLSTSEYNWMYLNTFEYIWEHSFDVKSCHVTPYVTQAPVSNSLLVLVSTTFWPGRILRFLDGTWIVSAYSGT